MQQQPARRPRKAPGQHLGQQQGQQQSQQQSQQQGQQQDYQLAKALLDVIVALVPDEKQELAQELAKEVLGYCASPIISETVPAFSETALKKVVLQGVQEALAVSLPLFHQGQQQETQQNPSQPRLATWATVAAAATGSTTLPVKANPPSRLAREVLVRGAGLSASLAKRTPQEIVQAVNTASKTKGAIAARKLPSGDVVVTFCNDQTKQWHSTNLQWIQQAFGTQATEARRTTAVLVKGLRKIDLQGVTEATFQADLGPAIETVRFRLPRDSKATRATALVAFRSLEEGRKACDQGLLWRAQLFDCEPYWDVLRPTQCYKCWAWGHVQRYCRKEALCGRCGTKAHGNGGRAGEARCPTHSGTVACRCAGCGGKHPAWARECPKKQQAQATAREAYQYRPRTFEPTAQPTQPAQPPTQPAQQPTQPAQPAQDTGNDNFQHVPYHKRARLATPLQKRIDQAVPYRQQQPTIHHYLATATHTSKIQHQAYPTTRATTIDISMLSDEELQQ